MAICPACSGNLLARGRHTPKAPNLGRIRLIPPRRRSSTPQVQTFRREHDRFWILSAHPDINLLAAGHDG